MMGILENFPLMQAFLTGIVSGFLVSVPVGPINVTIIHEGAERGFRWGILIGAGSVLMETIYCAIGFAGFTDLFITPFARATFQLTSFCLMLYLGQRYLFAKEIKTTSKSAQKIEDKFHPHTAFMTGFVRVLGNPGVLLMWIALSATFIAHDWVDPNWKSKGICIGGVATGAFIWFFFLSYLVTVGHRHLSDRGMLWMTRGAGAGLVAAALVIGFKLIVMLTKRG